MRFEAPSATMIALTAILVGSADAAVLLDRGRDGGDVVAVAPDAPARQPETLGEQLARVAELVAQVRELPFEGTPDVRYVAPEELAAEIRDELEAYTEEEAELDARLLAALGVVEPGTDLRALILTAYSEQVAGYYDPEIAQIVVPTDDPDERLGRIDELTLAHELGHALVDGRIGLLTDDLDDDANEDTALALTALQEGDAELVMAQYIQVGFSMIDQFALAQEVVGLTEQLAALTELPRYLQRSLEFPYRHGLTFVSTLHARGGWPAVDAAYADPPTTTYEILFPDAYLAGFQPVVPPAFTSPGGGWVEATSVAMGASDILLLFDSTDTAPERSARAWRGGELRLWTDGDASAVAWHLAHDGGDAFCTQLRTWYDAAIRGDAVVDEQDGRVTWDGPIQVGVLECDATTARLGIAPDVPTAAAMVPTSSQ